MSFLRSSTTFRSAVLRPAFRPATRSALPITAQRFAHQGYGEGEGDPAGEKPQKQPPAKTSDIEHPGPPPPDVGQGTGTTPTKGTSKGHNTGEGSQASSSNGSSSSSQSSSGSSDSSDSKSKEPAKGAQPKILHENPPSNPSEDVKQHNRELEQRAERADTKISNEDAEKDKVHPSFWAGHGGADKDP